MQIENFSLFRGLPADKVDQIKSKLKRYTYKEQEIISPQVSKANSLFLLVESAYNKIQILDLEGLTKVSPPNQDFLKLFF